MEPLLLGWLMLGVTIALIFAGYMTMLEEKRRCRHEWEETNRVSGYNVFGRHVTEYHLKCIKCGDVKRESL